MLRFSESLSEDIRLMCFSILLGERVVEGVRKASMQRVNVSTKEELGCTVKSEACEDILDVDGKSLAETLFHERQSLICMTREDLEVGYAVSGEEWASHGTMELPHVSVCIEDAISEERVSCSGPLRT